MKKIRMRVDAKNKRRSAVLHKKRLNKQFFRQNHDHRFAEIS